MVGGNGLKLSQEPLVGDDALHLDWGVSYTVECACQNVSKCTFHTCKFYLRKHKTTCSL